MNQGNYDEIRRDLCHNIEQANDKPTYAVLTVEEGHFDEFLEYLENYGDILPVFEWERNKGEIYLRAEPTKLKELINKLYPKNKSPMKGLIDISVEDHSLVEAGYKTLDKYLQPFSPKPL